jgi:hypothetical protein
MEKGPWEVRKYLIRVYRLKRLQRVLYRRDLREGRWAVLPKLLKIAEEGDEYQLEITGRKKGRPNAPGTSRRQHFNRPNSRKTKRDFIWNAPNPRINTQTQVQLAAPGRIGYREEDPELQKNIREHSAKELLLQRDELLKADDRIKPTVVLPMQEGTRGSPVEGCSPDLQEEEEDSKSEESPPIPAVTPEARKAIRTLEIIAAEKAKLDERDARRKARHEAIQAKIHRPPVREETKKIPFPKKKKKPSEDPAIKQAKSAEGKARQAKAESRSKKGKK